MATPPPHKNKPQITHLSTKPKTIPGADDGVRYQVVDAKTPDKVFGTDLPLKAAKQLVSKLSSSHKCRTAKVVPMAPVPVKPDHAKIAQQKLATSPAFRPTGVPTPPPLGNAQQVATQTAADAQKRHEAAKKATAERQRVAELAAKAKAANVLDESDESDEDDEDAGDASVDVDDLLGAPTDEEIASASGDATVMDPVTGRPPIPTDAQPAS